MGAENLPIRVYEGEPAAVTFLKSLFESAGIEVVTAGAFFGPAREVYVRRRDEAAARALLADFEANHGRKGDVLRGRWPT